MCLQCLTDAAYGGEVLPGWHLNRARTSVDGWKSGQLGLVEVNDPTFILTVEPIEDPGEDAPDELWDKFDKAAIQIEIDLLTSNETCTRDIFKLVRAATNRGYEVERDGLFHYWFCDFLAKYIKQRQQVGQL